jgi:hypothetical protein
MISSRELFSGPEQSENTHLVLREFVLVDGMFPLRGPALVATVNQSLDSKLSNAEDPTSRDELKGKGALVFSPSRWQPFIASSKEIVGLENLLWAIEIAKGLWYARATAARDGFWPSASMESGRGDHLSWDVRSQYRAPHLEWRRRS